MRLTPRCGPRNTCRMNRITPGQLVNYRLSRAVVCRTLKLSESTVWRWSQPVPKGTGGLVPSRYHVPLLQLAKELGVPLTEAELVRGVETQEIAA
jgi:hypothetical protein